MKIRNGFVSNSSTSSFLCDICHRLETEYEMAQDAEMYQCIKGHTFCKKHSTIDAATCDEDYYGYGELSEKNCPLCQMKEMKDKMIVLYFMKNLGLSRQELIQTISKQFKSYDEFSKYIK